MKKQLMGGSLLLMALALSGCGGDQGTTIVVDEPSGTGNPSSSTSSSGSSTASSSSTSSSSSGSGYLGNFDDPTIPAELQPLVDEYQALVSLDAVDGMPGRLTSNKFEELVKNSLRKYAALAYAVPSSASSSRSSGGQYQGSTVFSAQQFVVASDSMKVGLRKTLEVFDGRYWFVSSVGNFGTELNLDILELNANTANIQPLIDFKLVSNNPFRFDGVKSLNLVADAEGDTQKLILVAQTAPPDDGGSLDYLNKTIDTYFIGVADLLSPHNSNKLTVRGELLASHQFGDTLYLFTRRQPTLDGIITSGDSLAEAIAANEDLIAETPVSELFLDRSTNSECFAPTQLDNTSADSFIDVIAINLNSESVAFTDCFVAATHGLYFENNYFYTWASRSSAPQDKTVLYKFALEANQITPVSWGSVDSRITESNYLPQKKIYVADDRIRLIATNSASENVFYVLGDNNSGELEVLSALPIAPKPAPQTGGRTIFGATFIGDRSYVSTLTGRDFGLSSPNPPGPTYVVNTTDPLNPVIEMQLQLPDYASYIKPLSDDYLLTVSRAGFTSYDAQVDLLDVSDPSTPQVVSSHSFSAPSGMSSSGGPLANSPAVFDAESVTVVQTDDSTYKIAVPFDFTARVNNMVSAATDMLFFEASGLDSIADLTLLGQVRSHEYACGNSFSEGYGCIYGYLRADRRSIALGESLFYFYEGAEDVGPTAITSFRWDNFNSLVKRVSLGD